MNVYQKLSEARVVLQMREIKKSGHNKNLNFKYMELDDFLPHVNDINKELGLTTIFTIDQEKAILKVLNNEKPEDFVEFSSHTALATLKGGAVPIQELGSQHTYMRRYMFLLAYEISEPDALDPSIGAKQKKQSDKIDDKKAYVLKQKAGDRLPKVLAHYKINTVEELTLAQWKEAMSKLDIKPKEPEVTPDTGDMFDGHVPGA